MERGARVAGAREEEKIKKDQDMARAQFSLAETSVPAGVMIEEAMAWKVRFSFYRGVRIWAKLPPFIGTTK